MTLIIQKFGGSSLANLKMIKSIALKIIQLHKKKKEIVVILSAMEGITNNLINLSYKISENLDKRELDVLLTIGEQISVSLLSMVLKEMGYRAKSLLAHQIGIITNSHHGNAKILKINTKIIKKNLQNKTIVIVAGFQGTDINGNITTLGRGGSDTTAVAIAAALKTKKCEIYTDVEGVYTADPNIYPKARKIKKIDYDDIFYMTKLGSKVLHKQSVILAKKYNLELHVKSSFSNKKGSIILNDNTKKRKANFISIAYKVGYNLILFKKIENNFFYISKILSMPFCIERQTVFYFKKYSNKKYIDFIITIPKSNFSQFLDIEKSIATKLKEFNVTSEKKIAKVSIIGSEFVDKNYYASIISKILIKNKIKSHVISISKKNLSCLIQEKFLISTIKILHSSLRIR